MFLFQENHIEQIILGTKTQTRRIHKKWRANVRAIHQVRTELFGKPHCHIRILNRWEQRLGDINYADAHAEGGYAPDEYIPGLIDMHKGKINIDSVLKVYEFEVVKCQLCEKVIRGKIMGFITNMVTGDKWPLCKGCSHDYKWTKGDRS